MRQCGLAPHGPFLTLVYTLPNPRLASSAIKPATEQNLIYVICLLLHVVQAAD
ncbi:MAG: hypothetical protein ACJARL_001072 [Halopseudomonas sp.]|jgi:hypothetical protein